jgi:hypothetical protein
MSADRREKFGVCKLSQKKGKFVKAHLIPKALTKPASKGLPFVQAGKGTPPRKRWNSWYDDRLVIRKGEDVLAAYDDWAIAEFKRLQLVWGSWEGASLKTLDHTLIPGTPGWGVRKISTDSKRLRLFFLSILWRSAVTQRWEFDEISMPDDDQERLRQMLLEGLAEPISFYPMQLTQLSTKGEVHNLSPFATTKKVDLLDGNPPIHVPMFRFYMDGLIAHIARQNSDNGQTTALGPLVVGNGKQLRYRPFHMTLHFSGKTWS